MKSNALIGVILAGVMLAGCAGPRPMQDPKYKPVIPDVPAAPQSQNGSIYQAGYEMSLYQDVKARRVGDILTVRLAEETDASKSASTSTAKNQNVDVGAGTLLGAPVLYNGNKILNNQLTAKRDFAGDGKSEQSNKLQGSITVTVSRVLPNGNLVVRGEKWLTLNQGDEFIRLTGIVRPVDIATDNSVSSTKVANAQIVYSGRGAVADSNEMGWLARFFNSSFWPF